MSPMRTLSPTEQVDLRQMAITGRKPVAVIDLDHLAVAAAPAGGGHRAAGSRVDRFAKLATEIDARMHGRHVQEWSTARRKFEVVSISPFTGLRNGTETSAWLS